MLLKKVNKILEGEDFECTLSPSTENFPVDRLFVNLSLDMKKRDRTMEIFAGQQKVCPLFVLPKEESLPYRILFCIKLPFKVIDLALSQVSSLLHFINQFIDLPGFELNESEGEVLYRYVWIFPPSIINSTLIMCIVDAMLVNLSLFAETIESLADGKISFNDLLAQIVQISEKAKSGSFI